MNSNMKNFTIIALILLIVVSLLFLIVHITPLFIAAYIFILIGLAGLWISGYWVLKNAKAYPWSKTVPSAATHFLITSAVISAILLIPDQLRLFSMPLGWFIVIQAVILMIFAIRVILLNAGKTEIERIDNTVNKKVNTLKLSVADLESIYERAPDNLKGNIKPALEELRYSDPMSNDDVMQYDFAISQSIGYLNHVISAGNSNETMVSGICTDLVRQINDRNKRVKILKNM
jgi:hypothetical protein